MTGYIYAPAWMLSEILVMLPKVHYSDGVFILARAFGDKIEWTATFFSFYPLHRHKNSNYSTEGKTAIEAATEFLILLLQEGVVTAEDCNKRLLEASA